MRVFSAVVQVPASSVLDLGHYLAVHDTVAAQAISDEAPRPVLQADEQRLKEALCSRGIAAVLDQNVEYDAS